MKGGVEATRARLESVKETAVHGRSEDGLSYMHAFGLTQQLSLPSPAPNRWLRVTPSAQSSYSSLPQNSSDILKHGNYLKQA